MSPKSKTLEAALESEAVRTAARAVAGPEEPSLGAILGLCLALAEARGASETARRLAAELRGYQDSGLEVPAERRALGFASVFPVRALDLGLVDPEEIFLTNREKFSQVSLTISQPIEDLVAALAQIRQGGVLALRVPAVEVLGDAADADDDAEVCIYILPREIQRIVDNARTVALRALLDEVVVAAAR